MQLDERKMDILEQIINVYIKSGEPVGSKTLAALLENKISPSTIRNEMAVLYELGFLEQPHTSAGRIPSQLGYRLYIDKRMMLKPLLESQINEIKSMFDVGVKTPDYSKVLQNAAHMLAKTTKCAAVLSATLSESLEISKIEIIEVAKRTLAVILLTSGGIIKNKICRIDFNLTPGVIDFIVRFVNNEFANKSVEEVSRKYIQSLVADLESYTNLFVPILYSIYDICLNLDASKIYMDGQLNLLIYKELRDDVIDIVSTLSDKDQVAKLLNECKRDIGRTVIDENIYIKMGRELGVAELALTSVLVGGYKIGQIGHGNIMIIGPSRLDYSTLLPWLHCFAVNLSFILTDSLEII